MSTNKDNEIMLGSYQQLSKLGSGTFAIKKLKKQYNSQEEAFNQREIQVLQLFSHPNVIHAKKIDLHQGYLYIVFEYCDMNLTDFMREKQANEGRNLTEDEIRVIMKQILQGLEYIHQQGYLHRDIKPENFIISSKTYEVKMIDFGTVKDIQREKPPFTAYVSTRWYRAPEISMRSHQYGPQSDIFAAGCVMAELFTTQPLFPGSSELDQLDTILKIMGTPSQTKWRDGYKQAQRRNIDIDKMKYKKQPLQNIITNASKEALSILKKMLKVIPSRRLTATELLQQPFFADFQVKGLIDKIKGGKSLISKTIEVKVDNKKTYQLPKPPRKTSMQMSMEQPLQIAQQMSQDQASKNQQQNNEQNNQFHHKIVIDKKSGWSNNNVRSESLEVLHKFDPDQNKDFHVNNKRSSDIQANKKEPQVEYYPNQGYDVNNQTCSNPNRIRFTDKANMKNAQTSSIEDNILNDFGNFKVGKAHNSISIDTEQWGSGSMQAFPLKKDQPVSFAERVDKELRKGSGGLLEHNNFQYQIANNFASVQVQPRDNNIQQQFYNNYDKPQLNIAKPDSQQSMLARVASSGILGSSSLAKRREFDTNNNNLSVKVEKPSASSIQNSPLFSPLQPNSMLMKSQPLTSKLSGLQEMQQYQKNYQQQLEEQIEPFMLRSDSFGGPPTANNQAQKNKLPDNFFNYSSNKDIFQPFVNHNSTASLHISPQNSDDKEQQNILNKYKRNLDRVDETYEEHHQPAYKRDSAKGYSFKNSTGDQGNSLNTFHKGTFINNASNIFSSPTSTGIKSILTAQSVTNLNQHRNNGGDKKLDGGSGNTSDLILNSVLNRLQGQTMVEKKEKVIKGLVKAVNSGDFIVIHRSAKSSAGATELNAYLASVTAPKMGSSNRTEEPFAFDAREFLRDKIIGKKCEFFPEYQYGGRDYGTLIVNGENMNLAMIKSGFAKVVEKKGNLPAATNYDDLISAQTEFKQKKAGVFATDDKHIEKHTRNVTYFSDPGYNAQKICEESKSIDKPLEAIVEYVFSASYLSIFIHKFSVVAKISMIHLFTPNNLDKAILAEGKAFTEKLLLHRTVGVKLERYEEGGNLMARIYHPAGDIAFEVLKNGFSKLNQPKNIDFDAEYYKTLKDAQLIAQSKSLKVWKDFKPEEKKQQKPSTTDFMGRVVEIHSGDSLTVERETDVSLIRVFMATVKAPQLMKKPGEDPDPYAWESKEELRKLTIGKKVKVIMEFSRTVKQGESGERNMDFASVFLDKNGKNVAVILLEKGLLKTNVTKSGDNASKFLEDLLAGEKKGVDARAGIFSTSSAPIRVFNDLVQNAKKSHDFEAMIMKRPNRKMNGVVEYCFSGMRFKVRLDGENTAIALNLLGVRTMTNDKNQPHMLEMSNDALQFAKDTIFQRDVIIEPEFADKRGSFFGTLALKNKKDFGLMLVDEGLAHISVIGNKAPHNIDELDQAEAKAKEEGRGIWAKDMKLMADKGDGKKVLQNERIPVQMTDIQDATRFHIKILNDNQYAKIEQEMSIFDPQQADDLEKPIKKGTICAARFKVDENWYRARVLRSVGKGHFEVQFIDFGNIDEVSADDLKRLSEPLLQFEPQAKQCSLAYIRPQKAGNEIGEEAAKLVQQVALDKPADAIVVDQYNDTLKIVLFAKGEKEWNKSVNGQMVEKGLAMMQKFDEENENVPEEINDWFTFEEEAKEAQLKIWQYGGADQEDEY